MWTALVRPTIRGVFDGLGRGDPAPALAGLHPHVHHRFAGDHALGGERHDAAAVEAWFGRLFRLFTLDFDLRRIAAHGWPWDLWVTVEWVARVTPVAGPGYDNVGCHVIRIRRGRVVCLHAYEDSQAVAEACRAMAERGIVEAAAAPITS